MQLVLITHHSLLHLVTLSPLLTWCILIGAGYGLVQLLKDIIWAIRHASPPADRRDP